LQLDEIGLKVIELNNYTSYAVAAFGFEGGVLFYKIYVMGCELAKMK